MKKQIAISLLIALSFYGCSMSARYIDTESKEYISASLDLNDIKKAANDALDSLYESPFFKRINPDQPMVLAISDFTNDTTIKLDMEQITARIIEDLQHTGKFLITRAVSGTGGSTDDMISKARQFRENEEYNQDSVIEKGEKISASISLSGKVGQRITRIKSDQRIDYFFKIEIVNLKTGLLSWSKTIDISKMSSGSRSVW